LEARLQDRRRNRVRPACAAYYRAHAALKYSRWQPVRLSLVPTANQARMPVIQKTDLRTLAATIKARWICEQAHQQLKEELGLDRFEGRSWQGPASSCPHDHDRLRIPPTPSSRTSGVEKKNQRSTASTEPAGRTPRHRRAHRSTSTSAMSLLQKTNRRRATA
jgi:hypothetical protein